MKLPTMQFNTPSISLSFNALLSYFPPKNKLTN